VDAAGTVFDTGGAAGPKRRASVPWSEISETILIKNAKGPP
jgi:hypothetical protein